MAGTSELLAKERVCEGCRGSGTVTLHGTYVCKSCNGNGCLPERRKSRLQAEAQAPAVLTEDQAERAAQIRDNIIKDLLTRGNV